jgi:alanine-synthesizing transaminase
MFSDRSNWDLSPNALSLLLQRKKSRGETIFDLTESNPTRVGLDYEAETILAALAQPRALEYAPDPRGIGRARQAIAEYYGQMGERIDRDAVFLTAATSEAYSILFKLLGNPDDEILIPRPGYPLLAYLACFENLQAVSYPLGYDTAQGWFIDLDVLTALITDNTKAIVWVNPNNPTGSCISRQELAALDDICRCRDLALIVDEVFSDFITNAAPDRIRTAVNRCEALTFVLNGLSKMVGLPQLKLAWIVVGGIAGPAGKASARLEMMLDFYLSVATPVQHATAKLLERRAAIQGQVFDRISENSRVLAEQIARISNARVLLRQGGWYAIIEFRDEVSDEDRVLQLLEHENTLVHPGYFYDFQREGFVVVSLLPRVETFRSGIAGLIARFGRG